MYKTLNGWTKAKMIETIWTRNKGCRAMVGTHYCTYENDNGNHCAVGCFIPEGHEAMKSGYGVGSLIIQYPDLKFPLQEAGLYEMQRTHDDAVDIDPRPLLAEWIEANVEEVL